MEYRDLYDSNRVLTGEKINKTDKLPKDRFYITVVVFIQNDKDEFLLQINKKYNMWSTTGGHPKSGESSLEGIVTEIKEELGINIDKEKLILIKTYKTEDDFIDLYYLKENINTSEIIKQQEEVGEVKWFNKKEITKLIDDNKLLQSHIKFYKDCLIYLDK